MGQAAMPFGKYSPVMEFALDDRTWPGKRLQKAPAWCSVDLRDGNQALVEPMDVGRKMELFSKLVAIGFKEIEIGFPSASQVEYDFVRRLIAEGRIPDDVTVQVLVQCREELIKKTFEALRGVKRAIIHFYNSTSVLQRDVVFGKDKAGITKIATDAARLCRELEKGLAGSSLQYEYSPESFTGTEPEFALSICEEVKDIIAPTPDRKLIINLPATVEHYSPNVYADVVEWFGRNISDRDSVTLSVHPHNDRGTAVAAAELALLAGADRVEGTLFGNGERTGNVDVITLALNMFSQGIDPSLYLGDIESLVSVFEHTTSMGVPPRHPYAGELVFTAFSGSHQDAIKKGFDALSERDRWEVPYLPIDPKDIGRTYEAIVRVNSQSGKGGVAYVLDAEYGLDLPKDLQIDFSRRIQRIAEDTGQEVSPSAMVGEFLSTYAPVTSPIELLGCEVTSHGSKTTVTAQLFYNGEHVTVLGQGNGPIAALCAGLGDLLDVDLVVCDYAEHALRSGSDAAAVAYVALEDIGGDGCVWGIGTDSSILNASLSATVAALGRMLLADEQSGAGSDDSSALEQVEQP